MTNPNAQALVDAVVKNFLATGKDSTVKDIAELLNWSESKVRKVLNDAHGCPEALTNYTEGRPSYSTSYRGFESGVHQVRLYGPTRATLRNLLVGSP